MLYRYYLTIFTVFNEDSFIISSFTNMGISLWKSHGTYLLVLDLNSGLLGNRVRILTTLLLCSHIYWMTKLAQ